jgi:hypothetical protein
MAKYRETWADVDDSTLVGYYDTETGASIPLDPANADYRAVLDWLQSNTADPHFNQDEIDLVALHKQQRDAESYLASTSALVQSYRDAVAAGTLPPIPEPKYKKILNRRRKAARLINKTVATFTIT